ncbi:MAG: hypothetical protein GX610_19095 [Rhodococcus sp.]|nr:hypothetical protein [Rhodococcus sp. (in: high G+C Gram-positive bacteria)]
MSLIHRCGGVILAAAFALAIGAGVATAETPPDATIGVPGSDGNSGNVGIGGANVGPIGVEGVIAGPGGASVGGYAFGMSGSFPGFG